MSQFSPESIAVLIDEYGLNLEGYQTEQIVAAWLREYESGWIVKAVVEAVYRGRYQLKSVDGILRQWHRQGQPRCNFKPDFERERLEQLSSIPEYIPSPIAPAMPAPAPLEPLLSFERASRTLPNECLDPDELQPLQHQYLPETTFQSNTQLNLANLVQPDHDTEDWSLTQSPQTHLAEPTRNIPLPPRLQLLDTLKRVIAEPPRLELPIESPGNELPIQFRAIYDEA